MSTDAWLTLLVTIGAAAVLVRGWFPPSAALFGATVSLLLLGVIEADQALAGFSNPAPFTVAALYLVARAAERTGALTPTIARLLGRGDRERLAAARLLVPTAASSAVLNNTPIVAMISPVVTSWADRVGAPASRFLMPLSFAAILGGTVTVIGTSTNIVVAGLLEESGFEPIGMFEIARVGLPMLVVGLGVLLVAAPLVLPDRRGLRRRFEEESRSFVVDMTVEDGGVLDGEEVEAGGLRHLEGVYLVQIERRGDLITPVSPTTVLRGGDLLRFVGRADRVLDLRNTAGLESSHEEHIAELERGQSTFFEAVIGQASPLVGRTLREVEFRGNYQAAVVAIHRAGEPLNAKLGTVRLRLGDTLLLLADPGFRDRWYDRQEFLVVSRLDGIEPKRAGTAVIALAVVAGIVLTATFGVLDILEAALAGGVVLVLTRVLSTTEARNAVDLDVVITIASAFGLAAAIETSGLAVDLADGVVEAFGGLGPRGVLLGIIIATIVLTELVTNNAAAALMFPIAIAASATTEVDPRGMAIAVAVAASASFLTPIGYQTNTMVYGPGGYRFTDYARLGTPLTITVVALLVWLIPVFWEASPPL